jgi:hypothetical protein
MSCYDSPPLGRTAVLPVTPAAEMDALPLEYKLNNRHARGNLDIANVINDPVRAGVCGVYGLHLVKQPIDFFRIDSCTLL